MSTMNAVGWFDLYTDDLVRAAGFYEAVLGQPLEPMSDPTGETEMMSFPADMAAYGAGGALVKSARAARRSILRFRTAPSSRPGLARRADRWSGPSFPSEISGLSVWRSTPRATSLGSTR